MHNKYLFCLFASILLHGLAVASSTPKNGTSNSSSVERDTQITQKIDVTNFF